MSQLRTLADIAFHVEDLLNKPECFRGARRRVESYLRGDANAVESFSFPDHTDNAGHEPPSLTPGQGTIALIALHYVHCPNGRKLGLPPGPSDCIDERPRVSPYASVFASIVQHVQSLGDDAFPWFMLQLQRFEQDVAEHDAWCQRIRAIENASLDRISTLAALEDKIDFRSLLGLVEQVLSKARLLAAWTDGPLDEAAAEILIGIGTLWLTIEEELDLHGVGPRLSLYVTHDDTVGELAVFLRSLSRAVREDADWFKYLPDITDICLLSFAPHARMGMSHAAFARRLEVVANLLRRIVSASKKKRGNVSVEEADRLARERITTPKKKEEFFKKSIREQAKKIGCAFGTWTETPFFQEAEKLGLVKRKKGNKRIGALPTPVSLTKGIEAVADKASRDMLLEQLRDSAANTAPRQWDDLPPDERLAEFRQHEEDVLREPSPLCPKPKRVRERKRV